MTRPGPSNPVLEVLSSHTTASAKHLAYHLVRDFLRSQGHLATLEVLETEAAEVLQPDGGPGVKGHDDDGYASRHSCYEVVGSGKPLLAILEEYALLQLQQDLSSVTLGGGEGDGARSGQGRRRREADESDAILTLPPPSALNPPKEALLSHVLEGLHHTNFLSVSLHVLPARGLGVPSADPDATTDVHDSPLPIVITSAADRTVRLSHAESGRVLLQLNHFSANVLCHALYPGPRAGADAPHGGGRYLATGAMDGSLELLDLQGDLTGPVQRFTHHTKYLVRLEFAPDGAWLVTGSHDKSVHVYQRQEGGDLGHPAFARVHTLHFPGAVEALCFLPSPSPTAGPTLVVGCREDSCLHYIDLPATAAPQRLQDGDDALANPATWPHTAVSMNENGDDWISFTPMDLVSSPSGEHVLCYTDSKVGKVICFPARRSRHARTFYGVEADGFSRPRCCWSSCGRMVFATSEDHSVRVYAVASGSLLARLSGHTGIVRDLAYCAERGTLVSCSYDRTVRLWRIPQVRD